MIGGSPHIVKCGDTMSDDDDFDVDLLIAFSRGDEKAFAVLYRRHAAAVLRYAWAIADTPQHAEDLTQEVFVTFWRKAASASVYDDSLLPWLLTVCKNHARNSRRAESRHRHLPLEVIAEQRSASSDLQWILDDLDILSPRDRRLCELCLIEGYSYQEAARYLEISPAAAGKRLERARARLRRETRPW
jgi:RNA polymerase sigma factor (sigma-70 family)